MARYRGTVTLPLEREGVEIEVEFSYAYWYRPQTREDPEEVDYEFAPTDPAYKDLELTKDEEESLTDLINEDLKDQDDAREEALDLRAQIDREYR